MKAHVTFSFSWRTLAGVGAVILLNVVIFAVVGGLSLSSVDVALAQEGGDDDKAAPMDFYPEPFAGGAMAYSLRDPWDKSDLTFYFHNCPSRLDCEQGRDAVREGFQAWAVVSALTFEEVFDVSQADIEVTWTVNDPEGSLGEPGGVLAYNYFPRYGGDMYIDDSEPWTIGDRGEYDLVLAATHEIGHGIGLDHSEYTDAIMYAYAGNATQLGNDDIEAVQRLYGPPDGDTPPATDNNTDVDSPDGDIPASEADVDEVTGSIDSNNPYDIWDLEVQDGVTVTLTMTRTDGDLDALVGILTEDLSEVLAENDDWVGTDSRVVYTFETGGAYKVIATRYGLDGGSTSGSYSLTASYSTGGDTGGETPPSNEPPAPQEITWRISNFAGTELCQIYFSPSTSDTWGSDMTEGDPLQDGFYYQWPIQPDSYDVQVWDCFGNKLEQYNINATRNIDIQIYQNRITVVPLDEQPTTTTTTTTYAWRVSNYSEFELCVIYFSLSTETTWGENQIVDEDPLAPNFYYQWDLEPGVYDIRVEDCSGGFLEFFEIDLSGNIELAITQNQITPRPLQ